MLALSTWPQNLRISLSLENKGNFKHVPAKFSLKQKITAFLRTLIKLLKIAMKTDNLIIKHGDGGPSMGSHHEPQDTLQWSNSSSKVKEKVQE